MDQQSKAAFIFSQAVMLNARIAEMQAANEYRIACGNQIAYDDYAFAAVIAEYEPIIGRNEALKFLQDT